MESNLRIIREKAGFQQTELARRIGMSAKTIYRIERGETAGPSTYYKIFNVFKELDKTLEFEDVFPEAPKPKRFRKADAVDGSASADDRGAG